MLSRSFFFSLSLFIVFCAIHFNIFFEMSHSSLVITLNVKFSNRIYHTVLFCKLKKIVSIFKNQNSIVW